MPGSKDKPTAKVQDTLDELYKFINNLNQFLIIIGTTPDKIPAKYEEYKQYKDPNRAIEYINYLLSAAHRIAIAKDTQKGSHTKQAELGKRITDLKLGDTFETIKQKLTSTQNLTPKNEDIYLESLRKLRGTIAKQTSSSTVSSGTTFHEKPKIDGSYDRLSDEKDPSLGGISDSSSTSSSPTRKKR